MDNTLEITIQRRTEAGWPVVAEHHRPGILLPVRSEGVMALESEPLETRPRLYGTAVGEALFTGVVRDAFVRARSNSDGLRVLLCIEPQELKSWRWEWLCAPIDSDFWDFLNLDERVLFSLYLPSVTDRTFPPIGRLDLRTLVFIANPTSGKYNLPPFDSAHNVARLQAVFRNQIPVTILSRSGGTALPTIENLSDTLSQGIDGQPYTILHLVCHGWVNPDKETIVYFEQPAVDPNTGHVQPQPVTASDLIRQLRRIQQLPHLIFLSTCESSKPDAEKRMGGFAQRLVRELGIPAVIGMTERVSVDTAHVLADEFFQRLLAQKKEGEVDRALSQSFAALTGRLDINVPALYSRLGGRPLFTLARDRQLTATEIAAGLQTLDQLLTERAPTLRPRLASYVQQLEPFLPTDPEAFTPAMRSERDTALSAAGALCEEAIEISFHALAQGEPPPKYDSRQPFRGLSPFRFDDREFFFGREALIEKLQQKLREDNFLAVLGPSGSGKSSLVLAGLVPALKRQQPALQVIDDLTPGATPLDQLNNRKSTLPAGSALIIIDQFEELFTLCKDDTQRKDFVAELLRLASAHRVVITMRADFWGECAPYRALRERMQARQELIPSMTTIELRAAMEQQAAKVGLRFEAGLSNSILDEVAGEPGAMPLLQHALLELWKRRHGRWLRADEYQAIGGVRKAIAETADQLYRQLGIEDHQAAKTPLPADRPTPAQNRMRDVFIRLTEIDDDPIAETRRHTRRRVSVSDLVPAGSGDEETRALLKRLADAVLIVTSRNAVLQRDEVEVAHEALIRYWARLSKWIDDDLAVLRLRDTVTDAAEQWNENDRSEDFVQHLGRRLEEIGTAFRNNVGLSTIETQYLSACRQKDRDLRVNPTSHNVQEGGWGVIFSQHADPAVREALHPLLELRKLQATRRHPSRYREYWGDSAYRPGDTGVAFLSRHGLGLGQNDPDVVPRFLLIVGDPVEIPFEAQYLFAQLDYAVGRIHFSTVEEYANYAASVVAAEQGVASSTRKLSFFFPSHPGDIVTKLTTAHLLPVLSNSLSRRHPAWAIEKTVHEDATKERLTQILSGQSPAALLFLVSHALSFEMDDPRHAGSQGAIACSDWPGEGPLVPAHYLTAGDIPDASALPGSILCLFSEYSGGTPVFDDFTFDTERKQIANRPMLSPLSMRLLSLPRGPLAIIGHVGRCWAHSFQDARGETNEASSYALLGVSSDLMAGYPVGAAARHLRQRYLAITVHLEAMTKSPGVSPAAVQNAMIAAIDSRNWIVLGDPAARLML